MFSVAKGNQITISINRIPIYIKKHLIHDQYLLCAYLPTEHKFINFNNILVFGTRWFNEWFKKNKLDALKSQI